ncbi:MAG: hypothetical protein PHI97_12690, partial [Desulfobulbus sp.]|nr:hypothetical protein [Desulfobulbus sp.]
MLTALEVRNAKARIKPYKLALLTAYSGDSGHPGRSVATRLFMVSLLAVLLFCQWGLLPHRSSFEF